ncbi:P-loop containing nucleoside triphosphate hydrolase protein [Schizophyllum amplum]|uniref:ATP-dependent RNA helicase n=1 Tax=Schizophyllum amplum TaxID=97359 RepID=A0A550CWY9_9AGAR|nr:P-loop containing nucleoside triphosphate hydrolase protein [Auriculariopsis ampla]
MDDDIVLNFVDDDSGPGRKIKPKGTRADRVKAKRVAKRKPDADQPSVAETHRPAKKPRNDTVEERSYTQPSQSKSAPTQIISSLFSHNPRVEAPTASSAPKNTSAPSNAPLTDTSTFAGLGLNPLLIAHLEKKMSIAKPTAIQRAALPPLLGRLSEENALRDVFIQAQTGSGKTLSYLLPIIQDLLPLSSDSYIDRSIGTLAVIIAPTRELAQQISDVLENLLKLRLRAEDEGADSSAARLTRWLVSGLLIGGGTRTHEKARLRKGLPILVATPGRLLDHIQNTSSFNVGKCRWLVLDEADRLMELGFEETIKGITNGLDGRRRMAIQAAQQGVSAEVGGWDWERRRRTVLCSATIRDDVQKLAGTALSNPLMIAATTSDEPAIQGVGADVAATPPDKFTPPSQLAQKYVTAPLKLRLVTLVALLRSLIAKAQGRGTKIIVFLSCTDSVDFHWELLGKASMEDGPQESSGSSEDSDEEAVESEKAKKSNDVAATSALLPGAIVYRLHGSLPTHTRIGAVRGFSSSKNATSVLLCTSVASRGLDLPLVRAVIQYDLPTEGGATEYVHRVGRTARAGKGGEAWNIVAPSESEWVKWVETKMNGNDNAQDGSKSSIHLTGVSMESVLRSGFGGKGVEPQERATEVQLAFERWVVRNHEHAGLARKAYLSHMRAYATHPSSEKHIFHIRHLHLGHLAKAFALREAPTAVNSKKGSHQSGPKSNKSSTGVNGKTREWEADHSGDAERRMQQVVRAQGKLSKEGGVLRAGDTSEFQIAGTAALERMLQGSA